MHDNERASIKKEAVYKKIDDISFVWFMNKNYFCDMITNDLHLKTGNKIIYIRNSFENAVIKSVENDGIYVKFKGENEFRATPDSGVVEDAVMEANVDFIDKKTYDNW